MTSLAILAVVLAGAVGCRTVTGQSLGTNVDNQTLKANVKAKLAAEKIGTLARIGVDANEGVVYLTGNAESAEMKQRAEQIARQQDGVRQVVNNIQVDQPRTGKATGASASPRPTQGQQAMQSASPSASPSALAGRHTITGEVTDIDAARGHVTVKTPQRDMELYVP
ncbi:MAG: BON domain-containing protein, partial [Candidatus Rokuibacteriota bacterium]